MHTIMFSFYKYCILCSRQRSIIEMIWIVMHIKNMIYSLCLQPDTFEVLMCQIIKFHVSSVQCPSISSIYDFVWLDQIWPTITSHFWIVSEFWNIENIFHPVCKCFNPRHSNNNRSIRMPNTSNFELRC